MSDYAHFDRPGGLFGIIVDGVGVVENDIVANGPFARAVL